MKGYGKGALKAHLISLGDCVNTIVKCLFGKLHSTELEGYILYILAS